MSSTPFYLSQYKGGKRDQQRSTAPGRRSCFLNTMVIENGGTVPTGTLLQAKVEGEIAFILKKELKGPNVTPEEVLAATDYVVPALEIMDSRVKDWKMGRKCIGIWVGTRAPSHRSSNCRYYGWKSRIFAR